MKRADVVIVGGGIMGLATAYYLAREAVRGIVVLERARVGEGSTPRSAGMVRQQFASPLGVRLARRTLEIYRAFPSDPGVDCGLRECGYLVLAATDRDLAAAHSAAEVQRAEGLDARIVDRSRIAALYPELYVDDLAGAGYCASDSYVDPRRVLAGYADAARRAGVVVCEETAVTGITVRDGRVIGVRTPGGEIVTPLVVNAVGAGARTVAALVGDELPVIGIEHQIVVTAPPDAPGDRPMVVDFGRGYYFYQRGDGMLVGMGGAGDRPGAPPGFDEAAWTATGADLARRLPAAAGAPVRQRWTGVLDYTPDNMPILGFSRQVEGLFTAVAAGHGIMYGPALARAAAMLLTDNEIDFDPSTLSPARFTSPARSTDVSSEPYSFSAPVTAFDGRS